MGLICLGYAQWHGSQDEVYLATQESAGQRDAQGELNQTIIYLR